MLRSLVGSEMCIRDRPGADGVATAPQNQTLAQADDQPCSPGPMCRTLRHHRVARVAPPCFFVKVVWTRVHSQMNNRSNFHSLFTKFLASSPPFVSHRSADRRVACAVLSQASDGFAMFESFPLAIPGADNPYFSAGFGLGILGLSLIHISEPTRPY